MDEMGIPEDVMKTALQALIDAGLQPPYVVIARAILAERERCAKLAESYEREAGPLMRGLADAIPPAK